MSTHQMIFYTILTFLVVIIMVLRFTKIKSLPEEHLWDGAKAKAHAVVYLVFGILIYGLTKAISLWIPNEALTPLAVTAIAIFYSTLNINDLKTLLTRSIYEKELIRRGLLH